MNSKLLLDNLRNIPNFPKPGIQFKDVSTLFKNPECLQEMSDELSASTRTKASRKWSESSLAASSWAPFWPPVWALAS